MEFMNPQGYTQTTAGAMIIFIFPMDTIEHKNI